MEESWGRGENDVPRQRLDLLLISFKIGSCEPKFTDDHEKPWNGFSYGAQFCSWANFNPASRSLFDMEVFCCYCEIWDDFISIFKSLWVVSATWVMLDTQCCLWIYPGIQSSPPSKWLPKLLMKWETLSRGQKLKKKKKQPIFTQHRIT